MNHEAYRIRGVYKTLEGICYNVDTEETETILVGRKRIAFRDILKIEGAGELFLFSEKRG